MYRFIHRPTNMKLIITIYLEGDLHLAVVAEDDVLHVVNDGVPLHHLRRAEGLLDLALWNGVEGCVGRGGVVNE